MKKIILFSLLIILNLAFKVENCMCQWVQVVHWTGNVYALANSGNYIFAGIHDSPQGIYLSTNNGDNWTQTSINNVYIHAFAINGNCIFAGTCDNLYWNYKSTNNGTNWSEFNITSTIYSFAVSGNYVYAGTQTKGVYFTTNNGTNWIQSSLNNGLARSLAAEGNYVYAGTYSSGVYLSSDNGTNWTQSSLNNLHIWSLAVNGNNVYAGTDSGLYLSTNNGSNWTLTGLDKKIYALKVYGNNVFAGTYQDGIYISSNNGTNWTQRNEGLGNVIVWSFCIYNNYIFTGTSGYVYRRHLGELVGINPISGQLPLHNALLQNYPNPFNPSTNIKYRIANNSFVTLKVYDIMGREIETPVNEIQRPGEYEVSFNAGKLSSGVYFYKLIAGEYSGTKRMILLK